MLKRFAVEGYRCFRDKVVLDLGTHHDYNWHNDPSSGDAYLTNGIISNALVLGENATGKTNLGRALLDVKSNFRRAGGPLPLDVEDDPTFLNGDSEKGSASFDYVFDFDGTEVAYSYRKDGRYRVVGESLRVGDALIFEANAGEHYLDTPGLGLIGATGLNWDFSDTELSILGYLSNSLPQRQSPLVHRLRRFVLGMAIITVPTHYPRSAVMRGVLSRIVRNSELVAKLEEFLQKNGVNESLEVRVSPDGEPVLYFGHRRPIPFERACSSGTLTLLLLFYRIFIGAYDAEPSFVYIDEFDAYLHYAVAERLIRSFGSLGTSQTICSTHNTSLLRNVTMRPDCVFEIKWEEQEEGSADRLTIKTLADSTQREIRRINNVEHLYRNGEFE